MINRIRQIISESGLSQSDFAKKIGVTPAYVWKILNKDDIVPSDRIIDSICRNFPVSKQWIQTGEGNKYAPSDRELELATFFGDVLRGEGPDFIRCLLVALSRLSESDLLVIKALIDDIEEEMKKD